MRSLLRCQGSLTQVLYLAGVFCLKGLCVNGQVGSSGKSPQTLRITIRTNPWVMQPSGQDSPGTSRGNVAQTQNTQTAGGDSQLPGNSGNNQWFNNQQTSGNTWSSQSSPQVPPGGQTAPVSFDLRNKESISNVPQSKPSSTVQQSGSILQNAASEPAQAQPNDLPRQTSPDIVRNPLVPIATQADPMPVTPASTEQQVLPKTGNVDPRTVVWNRQEMIRQNMQQLSGPFNIWGAISRLPSTQSPPVLRENALTQSPSQRTFQQAIQNRFVDRETGLQPKPVGVTQATQETQPTQPTAQQLTQLPLRQTTRQPTTPSTQQRAQQPLLPLTPGQSRNNQVYPLPWAWSGQGMSPQQMWMFSFENQLENMPWYYRQQFLANLGTGPSGSGQSGANPVTSQSSASGPTPAPSQAVAPATAAPVMTTPRPVQPVTPSIADRQRLAQLMLMASYYERNCNQPSAMRGPLNAGIEMAPPTGQGAPPREPMACHCYPKRDCESVAFLYVNPQTTRECGSRVTGYACCCEDPRPVG